VQSLSVETTMVAPGAMLNGALVMLGRTAGVPSGFSKYGGVKICPSGWFCLRVRHEQGSMAEFLPVHKDDAVCHLARRLCCDASLA